MIQEILDWPWKSTTISKNGETRVPPTFGNTQIFWILRLEQIFFGPWKKHLGKTGLNSYQQMPRKSEKGLNGKNHGKVYLESTLLETNSLHLKTDGWKTILSLLWFGLFSWGKLLLVLGRVNDSMVSNLVCQVYRFLVTTVVSLFWGWVVDANLTREQNLDSLEWKSDGCQQPLRPKMEPHQKLGAFTRKST